MKGKSVMAANCATQSVPRLSTLLLVSAACTVCLEADSIRLGETCAKDGPSAIVLDFESWKQEVERVVYPAAVGKSLGGILDDDSELLPCGSGLIPWGVHSYRWGKKIQIRSVAHCIMTLSTF